MVDYLDDDCKRHFKHVLEFLDEAKVPYILNPHLVRGLDYYARTVFEFIPEENAGAQSAVISGGRYDKLVEMLGGSRTPAAGWGMGLDRVVKRLGTTISRCPDSKPKPESFFGSTRDAAKKKALVTF